MIQGQCLFFLYFKQHTRQHLAEWSQRAPSIQLNQAEQPTSECKSIQAEQELSLLSKSIQAELSSPKVFELNGDLQDFSS
jgi:hypothetical protein